MPRYKKPGRKKDLQKRKDIIDYRSAPGTNPAIDWVAYRMQTSTRMVYDAYENKTSNPRQSSKDRPRGWNLKAGKWDGEKGRRKAIDKKRGWI